MSRAFVKEDVDPPERSGRKRSASGLPPGATNYITARGAKHLQDELQKLRAANAVSERVTELEQILASVHVVDPPDAPSNSVTFGATVTVKDKKAAPIPIRCSVLTNSNSSRTPSVGFLRSAKRVLAAPFSDFQSLIVLAVDPTQSLRGLTCICRPFSQRRASILRDSVSFFRPFPVLERHSCRSESQHPRCIPVLWDWPFPPLWSC